MKSSYTIISIVTVLIVLYLLNFRLTNKSSGGGGGDWTVYGTTSCGWTRKQFEYMESKNITYKFVDCGSEDCKDITAFPTLKKSDGTTIVGFSSSL